MAEKHCKLCEDCIHNGTCYREGNKKAYKGDLDISGCDYFKDKSLFVEVVRCKDCKHWRHETIGMIDHYECTVFCDCYGHGYLTGADDFCSYGERKEQE